MNEDPAFSSAIERAYLAGLDDLHPGDLQPTLSIHQDLLETAIYRADPTNGGTRFKKLHNAGELEQRLQRALRSRLDLATGAKEFNP